MEKNSTGDSGTSWEEIPISAEKKSIFPKRRLLIVGRRQILAFLVLPIIVLIVFLSVFRLEGVPTNGKGLSQIVFNNGTIDTNTVLAVPFLSGSETEFQELINVSFHYQSNQDGEACDKNSIKVSGSTTSTDALVIDSLKRCFPETIASLAKELHFDILIYKSPFRVPGFTALAIWKGSTNSPIPMVEVGYRVNVEEIAFANLSPSNNPIFGGSNKKVLVFIAVVNAFLAIVQLYNGFQRLVSQQQPLVCNIRVSVCCLQIVSALLRVLFTADIGGLSHVYPYPLFRYFIAFGTVFVFGTIYLVALAFHFAYVAIANIRITSHAPFWIVAVITCILVIFELYSATANAFLLPGAGISIIISGVNAVLFQLLSGLYFVLSKRQVLSTLQKSQGTVKSRAFELRRMTDYLYLAMIPMTYFFVSMALYFLSYSNRDPQILSIVLAVMATGLTEMALVSSFPTNQKKSPRRTEMALESEGRLRSKGDLKTSGNI